MNNPALTGPCADYEHDLVDLHDGVLEPDRAHALRSHLGACTRCRAWLQAFEALDARLAAEMPRPSLSAAFTARLHERLAGESRRASRGELRDATDAEYRELRRFLEHRLRRRVVAAGTTAAAAGIGGLALVSAALPDVAAVLASLSATERLAVSAVLGVAIAIAGLASAAMQGRLPLPRTGA